VITDEEEMISYLSPF